MPSYDKDVYSRNFARLLNKAMKKGASDPAQALHWLETKYNPFLAMLFTRHRLEMSDAYMDVREHITKRVRGKAAEDE